MRCRRSTWPARALCCSVRWSSRGRRASGWSRSRHGCGTRIEMPLPTPSGSSAHERRPSMKKRATRTTGPVDGAIDFERFGPMRRNAFAVAGEQGGPSLLALWEIPELASDVVLLRRGNPDKDKSRATVVRSVRPRVDLEAGRGEGEGAPPQRAPGDACGAARVVAAQRVATVVDQDFGSKTSGFATGGAGQACRGIENRRDHASCRRDASTRCGARLRAKYNERGSSNHPAALLFATVRRAKMPPPLRCIRLVFGRFLREATSNPSRMNSSPLPSSRS